MQVKIEKSHGLMVIESYFYRIGRNHYLFSISKNSAFGEEKPHMWRSFSCPIVKLLIIDNFASIYWYPFCCHPGTLQISQGRRSIIQLIINLNLHTFTSCTNLQKLRKFWVLGGNFVIFQNNKMNLRWWFESLKEEV